jgi:translation initiation factor 1
MICWCCDCFCVVGVVWYYGYVGVENGNGFRSLLCLFLKLLYTSNNNLLVSIMAEVCSTCGLPNDLCVCGEIEKEQQRIRIRLETRKFGRPTTIIDGVDDKNSNLQNIAQKLKGYCACGGTHKNGQIMLQGDHRDRVREFLIKAGYPQENIELQ